MLITKCRFIWYKFMNLWKISPFHITLTQQCIIISVGNNQWILKIDLQLLNCDQRLHINNSFFSLFLHKFETEKGISKYGVLILWRLNAIAYYQKCACDRCFIFACGIDMERFPLVLIYLNCSDSKYAVSSFLFCRSQCRSAFI